MKKLTKKQADEQSQIASDLEEAHNEYAAALEKLNTEIRTAIEFRDEIVATQDEYISNRSERWAESETGEQYIAWKDGWEQFELEEIEEAEIDYDGFRELASEPGFE